MTHDDQSEPMSVTDMNLLLNTMGERDAVIEMLRRIPKALVAISDERESQNEKWGTQQHTWPEWLSILTEEVGEAARAANQAHWPMRVINVQTSEFTRGRLSDLRTELVQTAAVAVAIIEHIDELLIGESNGGQ